MNRAILLFFISLSFLDSSGQSKMGYFGKMNFIGYEKSIHPINGSGNIDISGSSWGKIKFERIISKNRTIGVNYERVRFLVKDLNISNLYLHNQTYALFIKKYNKFRAMVPVGGYHVLSIESSRNFLSSNKNDKRKSNINSLFFGLDLGKSVPLISNKLLFNFSAGLRFRIYKNLRTQGPSDINTFLLNRSLLRIDFGLSYPF